MANNTRAAVGHQQQSWQIKNNASQPRLLQQGSFPISNQQRHLIEQLHVENRLLQLGQRHFPLSSSSTSSAATDALREVAHQGKSSSSNMNQSNTPLQTPKRQQQQQQQQQLLALEQQIHQTRGSRNSLELLRLQQQQQQQRKMNATLSQSLSGTTTALPLVPPYNPHHLVGTGQFVSSTTTMPTNLHGTGNNVTHYRHLGNAQRSNFPLVAAAGAMGHSGTLFFPITTTTPAPMIQQGQGQVAVVNSHNTQKQLADKKNSSSDHRHKSKKPTRSNTNGANRGGRSLTPQKRKLLEQDPTKESSLRKNHKVGRRQHPMTQEETRLTLSSLEPQDQAAGEVGASTTKISATSTIHGHQALQLKKDQQKNPHSELDRSWSSAVLSTQKQYEEELSLLLSNSSSKPRPLQQRKGSMTKTKKSTISSSSSSTKTTSTTATITADAHLLEGGGVCAHHHHNDPRWARIVGSVKQYITSKSKSSDAADQQQIEDDSAPAEDVVAKGDSKSTQLAATAKKSSSSSRTKSSLSRHAKNEGLPVGQHDTTTQYQLKLLSSCFSSQEDDDSKVNDKKSPTFNSPTEDNELDGSHEFGSHWNIMFEKLKQYKDKHGDCLIPLRNTTFATATSDKENGDVTTEDSVVQLGQSVETQGQNKHFLCEDRLQRLETVDFKWKSPKKGSKADEAWNAMFDRLMIYKKQHGDLLVPRTYKEDKQLAGWVVRQRERKDKISLDRKKRLEGIDFPWSGSKEHRENWNAMFDRLLKYKKQHGHCDVPRFYDDDKLGRWVPRQRINKESMSSARRKRLEDIGFSWSIKREQNIKVWNRFFNRLLKYKETHGDVLVPEDYEDQFLARWVYLQRTKKNLLPPARKKRLDDIQFVWEDHGSTRNKKMKQADESWNEMFEKLCEYKRIHGHTRALRREGADPKLGYWTAFQRAKRKNLSDSQVTKLESIGFVWSVNTRTEDTTTTSNASDANTNTKTDIEDLV
mmetsp:Transcript_24895/g.35108  ORF Transcript_24895/g.35108 Transcript_24895/m.35108 type:complete len:978 (-) Transcript_24895:223-3156(-)